MNIIFLDIDGPLLPGKMHLMKQNRKTGLGNPPIFDNFAVTAFNLWAKYADAKIVFSTAWAHGYDNDQLKHIMEVNGLDFNYVDDDFLCTPKRMSSYRHDEILDWLERHAEQDMQFIAVDDDSTCAHLGKYFGEVDEELDERISHSHIAKKMRELNVTGKWIEVDFNDGLTFRNFKDGCEALGIEQTTIAEQEFGIKVLTKEEQKERDDALELLARAIF